MQVQEPAEARAILTACALCECVYKPVWEAYLVLPSLLHEFCVGLQHVPRLCFTAEDVQNHRYVDVMRCAFELAFER